MYKRQIKTNPVKAKKLFEAGCKLKNKDSCGRLSLINKGIVKVYDVSKSVKLIVDEK